MKTKKKIYGVGINDSESVIQKFIEVPTGEKGKRLRQIVWFCPLYKTWTNMISRCYSKNLKNRKLAYKDCKVCDEWLLFSNFKKWMETQDWEGKQLDKDLLFRDNRLYSPETCVFVDQQVNGFITEKRSSKGEHPTGVTWCKQKKRFKATIRINSEKKFLGRYDTALEAHNAWLSSKLEKAKLLAAEQSDPRVARALIDRYENYVVD